MLRDIKIINYIKNESNMGYIYPSKIKFNKLALNIIKELCLINLFSFDSYLIGVRKVLNIKYKIPLFINYKYGFIYFKAFRKYETIFINFFEVKTVEKGLFGINFIFNNGDVLETKYSYKIYKNLVNTIFYIIKYKESLE